VAAKVKVGILGAGYIAGVHVKALSKIPGVTIAAVCSLPRETAVSLAGKVAGKSPAVYDDFDAMLKAQQLDALFVCLPPFAHKGQVEKAARRGINVFVEKPLGLSSKQAVSMAAAVKKARVVGQVGYHMRFGTAVQKLLKLITSGKAGTPTLFDASYACNSLHGEWWRNRTMSGGQVFEQAIHLYDLAQLLLGAPVAVSGAARNLCHTKVPGYTIEDTSASVIQFKSGAVASITSTNCAVPMEWAGRFTVVCGRLTAVFSDHNNAEFVYTGGKQVTREVVQGAADAYLEEDRAFIAAVRKHGRSPASLDDGVTGVKLVEAVLKSSARKGAAVAVR